MIFSYEQNVILFFFHNLSERIIEEESYKDSNQKVFTYLEESKGGVLLNILSLVLRETERNLIS